MMNDAWLGTAKWLLAFGIALARLSAHDESYTARMHDSVVDH